MFVILTQKDHILFIDKSCSLLLFIHFDIEGWLSWFGKLNFILIVIYVGVLGYKVPFAFVFNCCRLLLVAEQGELGVEAWTDEKS